MLLVCDSYDHYTTVSQKHSASQGAVSIATGRHGNGLTVSNGVTTPQARKNFTASQTVTVGFAVRGNSFASNVMWMALLDGASTQVDLRWTNGGVIYVTRAGTELARAATILQTDIWYYLEFQVTIASGIAGSFELRIDGVTETWASGSGSSVNTQATGNASVSTLLFQGTGTAAGGDFSIDDLYLLNDTDSGVAGIPNDDFLGDVRVQAVFPNGNGNTSQLTGSDGNSTDNYLLVDEAAPNSDTDYVQSATVGEKDTYAFGNLTPTTGTTFGVQVNPFVRKTDAGARSVKSVARHSGTEVDSAAVPLSTTYQYLSDIREAKPGGGAWSISDVNGAEFGAKVA